MPSILDHCAAAFLVVGMKEGEGHMYRVLTALASLAFMLAFMARLGQQVYLNGSSRLLPPACRDVGAFGSREGRRIWRISIG